MKVNKVIISSILFVISFFIFVVLDVGMTVEQISQIVQPLFFALTLVISVLFTQFRKHLLVFSIVCLIILVITYLFGMIEVSDWIGRLGFGMFFITIFSYLPQLIKKGYIEKF